MSLTLERGSVAGPDRQQSSGCPILRASCEGWETPHEYFERILIFDVLEHFHFYSAQASAAKCGFSREKPRRDWSVRIHMK
jgi:hypothetical protein